jgi:hypothetical protein
MDMAQFLDDVADDLVRAGLAAHQLVALEFAESGRDINVKACKTPREVPYPKLEHILDEIGRYCLREGITVEQLRCITFFQERADLQFIANTGETKIQSCPVEPLALKA